MAAPVKTQLRKKKRRAAAAFGLAVGSVALTAAAIFGAAGGLNHAPGQTGTAFDPGRETVPVPEDIEAFGQRAVKAPVEADTLRGEWNDMLKRQEELRHDTAKMEALEKFLHKLDYLKGKPLAEQAEGVNNLVNNGLTYATDMDQYHQQDYWAAPAETAFSRKGDCEDYALLQRAGLLYLNVAKDRMVLTMVNEEGLPDGPLDHAILLLNEAPVGKPPAFYILGNAWPTLPAQRDRVTKQWGSVFNTQNGFDLRNARNEDGYWELQTSAVKPAPATPASIKLSGQKGPTS